MITSEIDFEESPEVYNSFNSEEKPLSVLIRYDVKTEPKIQFEKNDVVPENNQKIKVGVIGAGNFASTTIIPLLKELRKSCQVLGIASSGGLSSETLAKNFKIIY